jgi:hypothetical protein
MPERTLVQVLAHASVPEQLEPGAERVVHHEEGNPIGGVEVARADKLAVALEISEADKIRSQHPYEPRTKVVCRVFCQDYPRAKQRSLKPTLRG